MGAGRFIGESLKQAATNPVSRGGFLRGGLALGGGYVADRFASALTGGDTQTAYAKGVADGRRQVTQSGPAATATPEATATSTSSETKTGKIELLQFQSPEEAAKLYGNDEYSRQASSWEINQYGGAHLIPNPDGSNSIVFTTDQNGMPNTAVDCYIDIKGHTLPNSNPAMAFVIDSSGQPTFEMRGGTFWRYTADSDLEAGVLRLWQQVTTREAQSAANGGQPGVQVIPVGFNPNGLCK